MLNTYMKKPLMGKPLMLSQKYLDTIVNLQLDEKASIGGMAGNGIHLHKEGGVAVLQLHGALCV